MARRLYLAKDAGAAAAPGEVLFRTRPDAHCFDRPIMAHANPRDGGGKYWRIDA
jgi:hypothetical protein